MKISILIAISILIKMSILIRKPILIKISILMKSSNVVCFLHLPHPHPVLHIFVQVCLPLAFDELVLATQKSLFNPGFFIGL